MTQSNPDQCCHKSREDIPWLLNGALSTPAAEALREHIRECGDCQADLEMHKDMRAVVRGGEVTPMMPATRAEDIIGIGRNDQTKHSPDTNSRLRLTAIAASIAILGVALVLSFYPDRGADETNKMFETATSAGSPGGIDYVMQVRFEDSVSDPERGRIAAQLDGFVKWSVNDNGDYEVHVQLGAPSLAVLQEYEEQTAALAGVQSAKFTALQLPMR